MLRIYKYIFALIFSAIACTVGYSQQTTKADLLKLFFQANQSVKNGNNDDAKKFYTEIIKLSPGLPEPYLNLGNLYSQEINNEKSLYKACICFKQYLKLNPETSKFDFLSAEISRLTSLIDELKSSKVKDSIPDDNVPASNFTKLVVSPKLALFEDSIDTHIELPALAHKPDTTFLAAETDSIYLGRWISSEFGNNGRETWILDIKDDNGKLVMSYNGNSGFSLNTRLCKLKGLEETYGTNNNDTLCFTFLFEDSEDTKNIEKNYDISFDSVVKDLFGLDLDLTETSISDTTNVSHNKLIYKYLFNLVYNDGAFTGTQRTIVTNNLDEILSDVSDDLTLYKCPSDYEGFTYNVADVNKLYHCNELITLYNDKLLEASEKTSSLNDLGCMCITGIGINRNVKMAVAYFMEASMKNNLFATLNLARLYSIGIGVDKDLNKARELYNKAFEAGYTDAMVFCGDTYLDNNFSNASSDYNNALICYSKATSRRSPLAFYRLAWLYQEGLGVEKDENKSKEYYLRAKEMNYPDALADLGIYYRDGILFNVDENESIALLTTAANKGNSRAMFELSQMYLKGNVLKSDLKKSLEWRKKYLDSDLLYFDWYCNVKQDIFEILTRKINENGL